jgi:hypothetical protein
MSFEIAALQGGQVDIASTRSKRTKVANWLPVLQQAAVTGGA